MGSMISMASGSEDDKADGPYPVGVLLPGESPTSRKGVPSSKSRTAGSASRSAGSASKNQARTAGSSAGGSRRPPRAQPVPSAAPPPAFALTGDAAKKAKFRPGWAV